MTTTEVEAPEQFYCPITYQLMDPRKPETSPYMAGSGTTYSKDAIERWINAHHNSPLTREPLELTDLQPNRALAELIEAWLTEHNVNNTTVKVVPKSPPRNCTVTDLEFTVNSGNTGNTSIKRRRTSLSSIVTVKAQGEPVDNAIIAVVDCSGSMDTEVIDGSGDRHGFTRLDLVKHSLNTIINSLSSNDVLMVIWFSNKVKTAIELTNMTESNKTFAMNHVNSLTTKGATNLWGGIKRALELAELPACQQRNTSIMVFTDGVPNVEPSKGTEKALQCELQKTPLSSTSLHFFGYGYDLKPKLLSNMAENSGGSYQYIPDASMIGTVFVNWLANMFTVVASNATVGNERIGWRSLGQLHHDQIKQVVLPVALEDDEQLYLQLDDRTESTRSGGCGCVDIELNAMRLFQERVSHMIDQMTMSYTRENMNDEVEQLYKELAELVEPEQEVSALITALQSELLSHDPDQGQIGKAFSRRDWFSKWGLHHIGALLNALSRRVCSNFKDPSVQLFITDAFQQQRERVDQIFESLPPPEPSRAAGAGYSAPIATMASYNDMDGGCFTAESTVICQGNETQTLYKIRICNLKAGDHVLCDSYHRGEVPQFVRVERVIVQSYSGEICRTNQPDSIGITPWHPFKGKLNGQNWLFPSDAVGYRREHYQGLVVNLQLERNYRHRPVLVSNVPCCALGHGLTDNEVIGHSYFGDWDRINHDLCNITPTKNGQIWIAGFSRNENGLVNAIRPISPRAVSPQLSPSINPPAS